MGFATGLQLAAARNAESVGWIAGVEVKLLHFFTDSSRPDYKASKAGNKNSFIGRHFRAIMSEIARQIRRVLKGSSALVGPETLR